MNLSPRNTAIQLAQSSIIPHISINEVRELVAAAEAAARNVIAKERDPLLIQTLFDGALRVSGNPQAHQEQLGHTSSKMTQRYLKTLSTKESLRIKQGVDFRW